MNGQDSGPSSASSRRFRIAIDAQILRPRMSGVERSVACLVEALHGVAECYDFVVYCPRTAPRPSPARRDGFRLKRPLMPNAPRALRILWQQTVLPMRLITDRVDLLHAAAYTAPLLTPRPYVLTVYDLIALKFPQYCKPSNVMHYRLSLPRSVRRAARIIAPSECTRRDLIRLLHAPEDRIRVVPLGVGPQFHPMEDRARLHDFRKRYDLPERYILYVGNLEPKKNVPQLLEAFAAARRSGNITQRLVIAGQKAWHTGAMHEALKRHRLRDTVTLLRSVPESDLPLLYNSASLFVFPSLYEGFGLPPLEAMACGVPVVTTQSGALPEVVGDAALLLTHPSERELRVAMEKVVGNTYLQQTLRARGLERARQFTWERTARETVRVYDEVLHERMTKPQ